MLGAIISILGGVIAASSVIIARKPNAAELIEKVAPYQGYIGVFLAFFGLWGILSSFLNIGHIGLTWAIGLGAAAAGFTVGFLLGYGLISKLLFEKNPEAEAKGKQLRAKLINYQVPAGFVLIVLGVLQIVYSATV